MANKWIEHIRTYAKNKNISYSCAVSDPDCSKTYKEKQAKPKAEPKAEPVKKIEPNTFEANKEINKTRRKLTPAEQAQKDREYIYAFSKEYSSAGDAYDEKWKNTGLLPENKKEEEEYKKKIQVLVRKVSSQRRRDAKQILKGNYKKTKESKAFYEKIEKELKEKREKDKLDPTPYIFYPKKKKTSAIALL